MSRHNTLQKEAGKLPFVMQDKVEAGKDQAVFTFAYFYLFENAYVY